MQVALLNCMYQLFILNLILVLVDGNILVYPHVDHNQAIALMTEYICSLKPPIQYNDNDRVDVCEPGTMFYSSNIRFAKSWKNF